MIPVPNEMPMPAPRGIKIDRPNLPPARVQENRVQETSMNAYINDSFQSDTIEGMSSNENNYYDICGENVAQSDCNVSRLTKKENAAAELINNICNSGGDSSLTPYDQYNATYMEPRALVDVRADVEVIEDSTLTPTSNLPPPPPSLTYSPYSPNSHDHYYNV